MACDVVVAVGASASFGFVSRANSADLAADTPEFYRSFEGNYQPMAKAWDERIAGQPIRITQMRPPVTGPPSASRWWPSQLRSSFGGVELTVAMT